MKRIYLGQFTFSNSLLARSSPQSLSDPTIQEIIRSLLKKEFHFFTFLSLSFCFLFTLFFAFIALLIIITSSKRCSDIVLEWYLIGLKNVLRPSQHQALSGLVFEMNVYCKFSIPFSLGIFQTSEKCLECFLG